MDAKGEEKSWVTDAEGAIAGVRDCLRRWRRARAEGRTALKELSNAILAGTFVDASHATWATLAGAGAVLRRTGLASEARIRRAHSDLASLQDEMLAASAGLRKHASQVWAAAAASSSVGVNENAGSRPGSAAAHVSVGGGFNLDDLAMAAAEVADMLRREALVTATVVQGVTSGVDRDSLTVYASAWMMQPYVDDSRWRELQLMLREPLN
ncbi:unnamed protein product [Discosporangium mesarthrocarpum]